MCGNKMTIGDFAVAGVVFSFIHNDALGGGAEYTDKGKKIVQANEAFFQYVERLRTELAGHLSTRKPAPF